MAVFYGRYSSDKWNAFQPSEARQDMRALVNLYQQLDARALKKKESKRVWNTLVCVPKSPIATGNIIFNAIVNISILVF